MLKITASYSKKVPGTEEYSSEGYLVSIEAECPNNLLEDPRGLQQQMDSLFVEARQQVDQQLGVDFPPAEPNRRSIHSGNGNGRAISPSRRQPARASAKQINYAASLAKRVLNLGPEELAREMGVRSLEEMTVHQASDLIERLKARREA